MGGLPAFHAASLAAYPSRPESCRPASSITRSLLSRLPPAHVLILYIESAERQGRLEEIGENRVFPALFDGERKDGTPQQEDSGHSRNETHPSGLRGRSAALARMGGVMGVTAMHYVYTRSLVLGKPQEEVQC